jgi:hypothetical protein
MTTESQDDSLSLTPFDIAPEPMASLPPIVEEEPSETSVILYRNTVTATWEASAPNFEPEPVEEEPADVKPEEPPERGGWTVALVCAGVALIAICLLLPLAEENHQLAYQKEKLKADLEQIKKQVETNGQFLSKVTDDPTLAERLAERQMKFVREGTTVLDMPDDNTTASSPFLLVTLPPPNPMPPYKPLGGVLSVVGRSPQLRLYVLGIGLLLLAAGTVLGGGTKEPAPD